MQNPSLDPDVADAAPNEPTLTAYDEQHVVTYVRLLQAEGEGADWREVARIVLHIDPEREPDRARNAYLESSRARQMDDGTGTSLARRWLELEEIHRPKISFRHNFLRAFRGHSMGTTWCQNRDFLQPFAHNYCAAILVSCVQWGGSNA